MPSLYTLALNQSSRAADGSRAEFVRGWRRRIIGRRFVIHLPPEQPDICVIRVTNEKRNINVEARQVRIRIEQIEQVTPADHIARAAARMA